MINEHLHRIIIPLYDRTSDAEADEIIRDIRGIGLDGARAERIPDRPARAIEIHVREKLYRAVMAEERVELSRDEAAALWQTILNDAHKVSAFRG